MTGYDLDNAPSQTLKAGVIGYPIAHSLSPLIMTTWLTSLGIQANYQAYEVNPDSLERFINRLGPEGLRGVNVTLPHKQAVTRWVDRCEPVVEALGAANLVWRDNQGNLCADNTDVTGIASALEEVCDLSSRRSVCLIGAGGAARAAAWVLKQSGLVDIRIVNRSRDRAEQLSSSLELKAALFDWDELGRALDHCDLVIQATSLGMIHQPDFNPDLSGLTSEAVVFDMVYSPLNTALLVQARDRGMRTVDGLSMLIGQARPSFERFFGISPPCEHDCPVRPVLVQALENAS